MAWQNLATGGAECGPSNPLQNLVKLSENDQSLRNDSFTPANPTGEPANAAFRSKPSPVNHPGAQPSEEQQRQFFMHQNAPPVPQFVDDVTNDLESFRLDQAWRNQQPGVPPPPGINMTAGPSIPPSVEATMPPQPGAAQEEIWKQSFLNSSTTAGPSAPASAAATSRPMFNSTMRHMPMGFGHGFQMQQNHHFNHAEAASATTASAKGKERFVELDDDAWEEQFAKISAEAQKSESGKQDETTVKEEGGDDNDQSLKRLEDAWKNLQGEMEQQNALEDEMAQWEAQYGANLSDINTIPDDFDKFDLDALLSNPQPYEYVPKEENPYVEDQDPFETGQRLLKSGAPLGEAALAFEEACRRDETRGEAWRMLGDTCAANEQERKAMRALERALACPGEGGQGTWMSLAVCYVNEGYESKALAILEKWLSSTYPHLMENRRTTDPDNPWDGHQRAIETFLEAARAGPSARTRSTVNQGSDAQQEQSDLAASASVDPDVQIGLGMLFYSSSDYNLAKDCFEAALSVRPNDFFLWNRLGATLANGGKPEDAINAYHKALELRPSFTRAIYNLGVSCLNIHCYQEAAEHLLNALSLHRQPYSQKIQERIKNANEGRVPSYDEMLDTEDVYNGSANLWNTLRRTLLCMDRGDLAAMCGPQADLEIFRKEGFEF